MVPDGFASSRLDEWGPARTEPMPEYISRLEPSRGKLTFGHGTSARTWNHRGFGTVKSANACCSSPSAPNWAAGVHWGRHNSGPFIISPVFAAFFLNAKPCVCATSLHAMPRGSY